jgi:signal transduction histidine kinase
VRLLRSPVVQFLLVGLLAVIAISFGTDRLAGEAAQQEAVNEARARSGIIASSVIAPNLKLDDDAETKIARLDQFDRLVIDLLKGGNITHVVIVNADGRVLYSDDVSRRETDTSLTEDQSRSLRTGTPGSRIVRAGAAGEAGLPGYEPKAGPQLQTWTRIKLGPGIRPLLFEAYFPLEDVDSRRSEITSSFRWITLGPLLLLIAIATVMLQVLTRQVTSAAAERERLLRAAIDASDAERRRIARDLHDSVVQDLAGTAFTVSALARDPSVPEDSRGTLQTAAGSLRDDLKSLRSLLAEIHPPDLRAEGLPAALGDLIAPAEAAGVQASVSVEGAETASDRRAALVWRVAQEAVRNAMRHSEASTLAVTVRGNGRRLTLEVVDDGVGFDPSGVRDRESFGLRGLRSLVSDAGGTLEVRSSPREGTTVHMEVDAQ